MKRIKVIANKKDGNVCTAILTIKNNVIKNVEIPAYKPVQLKNHSWCWEADFQNDLISFLDYTVTDLLNWREFFLVRWRYVDNLRIYICFDVPELYDMLQLTEEEYDN